MVQTRSHPITRPARASPIHVGSRDSADVDAHSEAHVGLHPLIRLHARGVLLAALGDTTAARHVARQLESTSGLEKNLAARTLAWSVRAHVAAAANDPYGAIRAIEAANWPASANTFVTEAADRYLHARMLLAIGRVDEARGWFEAMAQRSSHELPFLAPSQLQLARIYESRGDTVKASIHYRRFVQLWEHADRDLQPVVANARQWLSGQRRK